MIAQSRKLIWKRKKPTQFTYYKSAFTVLQGKKNSYLKKGEKGLIGMGVLIGMNTVMNLKQS